MTPPKPSRRRLTQAEWEAELARAQTNLLRTPDTVMQEVMREAKLRTRTGRRRSWWQRGWKR